MEPTVREVLALPVVAEGEPVVLAGSNRLDQPVRWLHVSDAIDLVGLLQGGELVLTTGLPLTQDEVAIRDYLHILVELGVVGLVVELGTHLQRMPDVVAGAAEDLDLPVVALTRRIRFVEVTEQVHRMIIADRYDEVLFARATHETFTTMNIGRASPRDIVTKASEILEAPLVLEDLNRHVLAFCTAGVPAAGLLDDWTDRSRRHAGAVDRGAAERGSADRGHVDRGTAESGTAEVGDWFAVAVGVGAERWGRLVVPAGTGDPARTRMVLERAAQSLQLQRMLEQDRDALLVQALGGLLDDLVSGRVTDDAEAIARARALGLAAGTSYVPVVIKIGQRPGAGALVRGAVDRQVLSAVRQGARATGLTAIASIRREGTIVAVLSCPEPATADDAPNRLCAELEQRLAGRRVGWAAGTANAASGLVAAAGGLAESEHVAEVGLTMPGRKRLFRSADVRLRGLFALLRTDHRLAAFAETELGRLLDHDARTGENLTGVLRAYLVAGGSKSEAAEAAGLSRPTLYARLGTIERILGVPLDSVESRTSLHAAMMIIETRGRVRA